MTKRSSTVVGKRYHELVVNAFSALVIVLACVIWYLFICNTPSAKLLRL